MNRHSIYERFYDELYDPDKKIQFIEERYPNDNAKLAILYDFKKSAIEEKRLNKDLSIFNFEEISSVVGSLNYITENAIQKTLSYFSMYTEWCITNGLRGINETGVNDIAIFMATQDLSKYISRIKAKNRYLTKEEAYDLVDNLVNYVDKAYVLSLFEGILGTQAYELRSMQLKNINYNKNTIKLTNKVNNEFFYRDKRISDKLISILKEADKEEEYYIANGEPTEGVKTAVFPLVKSPYIIRPIERKSNLGKIASYVSISQKIASIRRYTNYEFISIQSLADSGMINRVIELTQEYNLNEPTNEIFNILQDPQEYGLSIMQVQNLKQKYRLATSLKNFQ